MESYIKFLFGSTKTHYNEMAENRQSMTAKSSRDVAERRKEEIYRESIGKAIKAISKKIVESREMGLFETFMIPYASDIWIDKSHVGEIKSHFESLGYEVHSDDSFYSIIVKW